MTTLSNGTNGWMSSWGRTPTVRSPVARRRAADTRIRPLGVDRRARAPSSHLCESDLTDVFGHP
ncbi:hypothetical protein IOD13_03995 [Brevibacterium casei]|nr:hypothetical protein [Brevibacterium casei]